MAANIPKINLALQGGGAHGAFAWGAIDYFLEHECFEVEAVTATSAGAMNAVALAYGLHIGGREGAREKLREFWKAVSDKGRWFTGGRSFPWQDFTPGVDAGQWLTYAWVETISRTISPYDFNPFNYHPLREVLESVIDFDALHACRAVKLFVSATNVATGKVKVFDTEEVSVDAVLASACLPFLFQAVEIEGQHYWDGGYIGNPSLWPLFYDTKSRDIFVIQLNPMVRRSVPQRPSEILNRINEISFNSSLVKEMRSIAFVQKLVKNDWLKDEHKHEVKDVLFHAMRADQHLCDLSVASKFDTDWRFFEDLFERGRKAAELWFAEYGETLGRTSSVDLHAEFLDD